MKYDTEKDGDVVPLDKDRLKDAPRCANDRAPEYTSDCDRTVNGCYGID